MVDGSLIPRADASVNVAPRPQPPDVPLRAIGQRVPGVAQPKALVLRRVDPTEAQGVVRGVLRLDLDAARQGVLALEAVLDTPVLGGVDLGRQAPGEEQDDQEPGFSCDHCLVPDIGGADLVC